MRDQIRKDSESNCSITLEYKDTIVEENISPFKVGKITIGKIMNKYLTRKFTEDIDYIEQKGGIINPNPGMKWIEESLQTSVENGLMDNETLLVTRIGIFDSNQPAPEEPISNIKIIFRLLCVCLRSPVRPNYNCPNNLRYCTNDATDGIWRSSQQRLD
jgi:hypothetical protein